MKKQLNTTSQSKYNTTKSKQIFLDTYQRNIPRPLSSQKYKINYSNTLTNWQHQFEHNLSNSRQKYHIKKEINLIGSMHLEKSNNIIDNNLKQNIEEKLIQFQSQLLERLKELMKKITKLEYQIAQYQRHFNYIELSLKTKIKQYKNNQQQNDLLIQLNKQVNKKMEQLRQSYENAQSDKVTYNITKLAEKLQKMKKSAQPDQFYECQNCNKQKILNSKISQTFQKVNKLIDDKNYILNGQIGVIKNEFLKSLSEVLQIFINGENNEIFQKFISDKIVQNINLKSQIFILSNDEQYCKNMQQFTQKRKIGR